MIPPRHELKFVVNPAGAARLRAGLGPFSVEDPQDPGHRGYPITSLYYDSPQLAFAYDKVESVGQRRKVRLRFYSHQPVAAAGFLEIKEKHGAIVHKKRVAVAPDGAGFDLRRWVRGADPVSSEVEWLRARFQLVPAVWVSYRRRVWVGRFGGDRVRVTLDRDLFGIRPGRGLQQRRRFLPAHLEVLEVKVEGRLPRYLQELLAALEFQQIRYSKYVEALLACAAPGEFE